jgi:UPF0176 protein
MNSVPLLRLGILPVMQTGFHAGQSGRIKIFFMAALHNRVSRRELKRLAKLDQTPRKTISFYRYTQIKDPESTRDYWYAELSNLQVFGRIYMAREGVNAQINVPEKNLQILRIFLESQPGFQQLRLNLAVHEKGASFFVLDIKVKEKIVADGIDDPWFDMSNRGKYVDAEQFNDLTAKPGTVVVDMRNYYEYEVGHFRDAIEVPSDTFRDQLPMAADMLSTDLDRNIIMYCTGGIRCEKASAYMLHRGYKNVFHLEGGIINYVRQVREKGLENKFLGKNFVFDERLGERISDDVLSCCHQCGKPADTHVNCASEACHLLFIQCDECKQRMENCCSDACLEYIHLPAEQQKLKRKGIQKERNIFNKSQSRIKNLKMSAEPADADRAGD